MATTSYNSFPFHYSRFFMSITAKGIIAALLSNILFSMLFLYGKWLTPMVGTDIFAWRMLGMFVAMLVFLTLFSAWGKVRDFVRTIGKDWRRWLLIAAATPITAGQMWLFMWAPLNGKGIDVAMGYFLFPLAMMLGGVCVFGERLARQQQIAVALAACGVTLELWRTGTFSWATVAVFATYPIYYLLRRWQRVPAMVGLLIDFTLIAPFALLYVLLYSPSVALIAADKSLLFGIVVLGVHGVVAMQLNLAANGLLPVVLFGRLSYLEPALLFVIAITLLGEALNWTALASYACIWAAIVVMMHHSWQRMQVEKAQRGKKII